jgi:hypothetical protein
MRGRRGTTPITDGSRDGGTAPIADGGRDGGTNGGRDGGTNGGRDGGTTLITEMIVSLRRIGSECAIHGR